MRLTRIQMERMVRRLLHDLEHRKLLVYKAREEVVLDAALQAVLVEVDRERKIEQEAHAMVDDLEKKNVDAFDRHKMYLMIKKKLAKARGVIL